MKCITLTAYDIIIMSFGSKERLQFLFFLWGLPIFILSTLININLLPFQTPFFTRIIFKLYDQATKDDIRIIRIQQLPEGPFYVARKTINEHISKSTNCARLLYCIVVYCVFWSIRIFYWLKFLIRWCKYASVGLTVFGTLQWIVKKIQSTGLFFSH